MAMLGLLYWSSFAMANDCRCRSGAVSGVELFAPATLGIPTLFAKKQLMGTGQPH
jgi:hypothetical protein